MVAECRLPALLLKAGGRSLGRVIVRVSADERASWHAGHVVTLEAEMTAPRRFRKEEKGAGAKLVGGILISEMVVQLVVGLLIHINSSSSSSSIHRSPGRIKGVHTRACATST